MILALCNAFAAGVMVAIIANEIIQRGKPAPFAVFIGGVNIVSAALLFVKYST
jgi:hypothetical protein